MQIAGWELLRVKPVYEDVEHCDFDVVQCYALVCLFPSSVIGSTKILGVVADYVLVDVVALLFGADKDGNDLALSCYAIRSISK
jgi:hypothetical protein